MLRSVLGNDLLATERKRRVWFAMPQTLFHIFVYGFRGLCGLSLALMTKNRYFYVHMTCPR